MGPLWRPHHYVFMDDIRRIPFSQIEDFVTTAGEKRFRTKQIHTWLWVKGVAGFDEMTDLSAAFREKLSAHFSFHHAAIEQEVQSKDKTAKYIIRLHDEKRIEGVLIPTGNRVTACLSSQVGCPLGCAFCATGKMGFVRNLHYSEMMDEFFLMNRRSAELYGRGITNIVFMGMGEPLLNLDNVSSAVQILTDQTGIGISPTRITLSTAGIVKGIRALAETGFPAGLAVSLHSAEPTVREKLMPVTKTNSLHDLQAALSLFHKKTGTRITIEYLLLSEVNDTQQAAERLARFCRPFPVKINIIEYNDTAGCPYRRSFPNRREAFIKYLEDCNMVVNVRQSRGQDIAAACGQLIKQQR